MLIKNIRNQDYGWIQRLAKTRLQANMRKSKAQKEPNTARIYTKTGHNALFAISDTPFLGADNQERIFFEIMQEILDKAS